MVRLQTRAHHPLHPSVSEDITRVDEAVQDLCGAFHHLLQSTHTKSTAARGATQTRTPKHSSTLQQRKAARGGSSDGYNVLSGMRAKHDEWQAQCVLI